MQRFSIRRAVVTIGAVAALALGTGIVPGAADSTPTAQAAELARHHGPHGGHGGGHGGGGWQGGGQGGWHGGGGGWHGQRFFHRPGFSHSYWGYGFHRHHPSAYVVYVSEPVGACEAYYFDEGVWYCFVGY